MEEITALPGYILVKPYVNDKDTFSSVRKAVGEALISEVLAVGDSVVDDNGTLRTCPVSVGDVIVHAYNAKDFEIKFKKRRFVHFTEIYGKVNVKKDERD